MAAKATLTGIDAVIYGVADMDKSRRYFTDWGLKSVSKGKTRSAFRTQDGSEVILLPRGDKSLPKAIEPGSTLREMVWGVKAKADLGAIEKELSKDRVVTKDKDGTVHSVDDMGLGIAFRVSKRKKMTAKAQPLNSPISAKRVDSRATYYDKAEPLHIGHAVFAVPDVDKMEAFYAKRLGFRVSDYYTGLGVFLRSAPRAGHHNLFFMKSPDGKPKLNHVAFSVRDIHELFAGGNNAMANKWAVEIGPGRHRISSCYFWYFKCPAGGATEYFFDEDSLTENWKPGHWSPAPDVFAEWVMDKGIAATKRKPPTRNAEKKAKKKKAA